jgi:PIN domain nuclease of toxin-antitoxin system
MAILIDTHILIWWCAGRLRQDEAIYQTIADPTQQVLVSAASFYEIAQKQRTGKFPPFDFVTAAAENRFEELALSATTANLAGLLEYPHRDPFDRILLAESIHRNLVLATADSKILDSGLAAVMKVETR